jgi:hypothetical protein
LVTSLTPKAILAQIGRLSFLQVEPLLNRFSEAFIPLISAPTPPHSFVHDTSRNALSVYFDGFPKFLGRLTKQWRTLIMAFSLLHVGSEKMI